MISKNQFIEKLSRIMFRAYREAYPEFTNWEDTVVKDFGAARDKTGFACMPFLTISEHWGLVVNYDFYKGKNIPSNLVSYCRTVGMPLDIVEWSDKQLYDSFYNIFIGSKTYIMGNYYDYKGWYNPYSGKNELEKELPINPGRHEKKVKV